MEGDEITLSGGSPLSHTEARALLGKGIVGVRGERGRLVLELSGGVRLVVGTQAFDGGGDVRLWAAVDDPVPR